jgi:hypothetical protein
MKYFLYGALALALAAPGVAQGDGFQRERNEKTGAQKDALEGKAPPALDVTDWMNADTALDLASLRGKVVLLDFWGTW